MRLRILVAAASAAAGIPFVALAHADTSATAACGNGAVSDPTGDDSLGADVNTPDTDLTGVTPSYDATNDAVTVAASVVDLDSVPEGKAFEFFFTYQGNELDLLASRDALGTSAFELDSVDATTGAVTTVAGADQGITGAFDDLGNIVSITMPVSTYNDVVRPQVPLAAGGELGGLRYFADRNVTQVSQAGLFFPADDATPDCSFVLS